MYLGAAANGVLYTSSGQEVDALRGTDGTTIWRIMMNAPAAAPQISAGNSIYLNNVGEVYALDAATGAQLWHYKPQSQAGEGDATVSAGGGLVFAGSGLQLEALHASDGTLAWHKDFYHLVESPSYADGVVYVSSAVFMSPLYALNPVDGSQMWSVQLHGNNSWPAVLKGGTLYLSRSAGETAQPAGYMYALNPANGSALWEYTQSGVGFTNAIVE